jgi:hypothetical protein
LADPFIVPHNRLRIHGYNRWRKGYIIEPGFRIIWVSPHMLIDRLFKPHLRSFNSEVVKHSPDLSLRLRRSPWILSTENRDFVSSRNYTPYDIKDLL